MSREQDIKLKLKTNKGFISINVTFIIKNNEIISIKNLSYA